MNEDKIPIISLAKSSVAAFRFFNPMDWSSNSKAIILSCSTELSLLYFEAKLISNLCRYPKRTCKPHFERLQRGWGSPDSSLPKTICFAQVPVEEGHVLKIISFYESIKPVDPNRFNRPANTTCLGRRSSPKRRRVVFRPEWSS